MSDAFYEYLSDDVRALCRLCDKCTGLCNVLLPYLLQRRYRHSSFAVKGSVAPMSFYTYDVNPYPVLPSLPKNGTFWDIFPPTTTVEYAFLLTLFFCHAVQLYFIRYRAKFGTGVQAYLDGQWAESKQILTECQRVLPHDGPTKTLLSTMSKSNFQAPRQWRGYRELTSK